MAMDLGFFEGAALILLVLGWGVRGIMTRSFFFYWFMIWNMFLAAAPVPLVLLLESTEGLAFIPALLLSAVWLLFLPNTFYLLTDFMHLNPNVLVNRRHNGSSPGTHYERGDALYVVDSLLLFLTTLFGVVIGGFVLEYYYRFLIAGYPGIAQPVMAFVVVIAAIGLYVGRFGRWNSWDAIIRPHKVLGQLISMLNSGKEFKRFAIITLITIAFELFSWAAYANILI